MRTSYAYLAILIGVSGIALGADAAHPAATASDWQVNSQGAFAAIMKQLQELLNIHAEYKSATSILGWAIAGAGTVVAIARLLPGPWGAAVGLAWDLLAPKWLKQQEAQRDVLASGFHNVAEIMKTFPKDSSLGSVIAKLQTELPEPVKQAYREWEKSQAPDRPPTTQQLVNTARIQAVAALSVAKEVAENPPSDALSPKV